MKELIAIQGKLNAPKGQRNSFGKYNYRSAEDILEALKPLLRENKCYLNLSDEIALIGDRYYVKATATITNETGVSISTSALAREEDTKKGMDASQITGSTSSYARKYALNGLFAIDDNKDADTDEFRKQSEKPNKQVQSNFVPSEKDIENLNKVKSKAEFIEFTKQFDRWKEDEAYRSWVKTKWVTL